MDSRLWMHYNAVCVTPAMALTKPGAGSHYAIAGLDSKHQPLDGAKTYKLHLPPNVPVKDNWSVTIYDTQTRSMLQTDQKFAGVNSLSGDVKQNADGSYDIWFAPKAPKGKENNWIQTIPGKSWFIILRAYGPLAALDRQDLASERARAGGVVESKYDGGAVRGTNRPSLSPTQPCCTGQSRERHRVPVRIETRRTR